MLYITVPISRWSHRRQFQYTKSESHVPSHIGNHFKFKFSYDIMELVLSICRWWTMEIWYFHLSKPATTSRRFTPRRTGAQRRTSSAGSSRGTCTWEQVMPVLVSQALTVCPLSYSNKGGGVGGGWGFNVQPKINIFTFIVSGRKSIFSRGI